MADPDDSLDALGDWHVAELRETAQQSSTLGVDAGLPAEVRFTANVAKLLRRRRAKAISSNDPNRPAIFLLQPTLPGSMEGRNLPRIPMLDNGGTIVSGRVWFVGAVAASGRYVDLDTDEDDEMVRLITDTLALGRTPTIVFDPRVSATDARFYPSGLDELDQYELIDISDGEVTLDAIYEAIERVYRSCLVTPEAQPEAGRLWYNADRWHVSSKAESIVQLNIKAGLVNAFPTCTVRHEQTLPEGRLDLEIEQADPIDPSQVTRHAILELKVLKSYRESGASVSPAENLSAIEKGVNQAYAYRTGKRFRLSALCCFDMRRADPGDACFDPVRDRAENLCVHLLRWFLFPTSEHYRNSLASSA